MRTVVPEVVKLVPAEAKRVFKGILYDVYHWQQKRFDGSTATFEMLKRIDTVKVIAIKDSKLVVINDDQPQRGPILTMPGGRHDVPSETELDCAKRELHEETGMVFSDWRLIYTRQPSLRIEHIVYIFLATGFVRQETPHTDPGENITVRLMSFEDAKKEAAHRTDGYWPSDLLNRLDSLEELLALPEYR